MKPTLVREAFLGRLGPATERWRCVPSVCPTTGRLIRVRRTASTSLAWRPAAAVGSLTDATSLASTWAVRALACCRGSDAVPSIEQWPPDLGSACSSLAGEICSMVYCQLYDGHCRALQAATTYQTLAGAVSRLWGPRRVELRMPQTDVLLQVRPAAPSPLSLSLSLSVSPYACTTPSLSVPLSLSFCLSLCLRLCERVPGYPGRPARRIPWERFLIEKYAGSWHASSQPQRPHSEGNGARRTTRLPTDGR